MNHIGDKIRLRRKEMNMTQKDLATALGYKSSSTINKIELGINDISQTSILKIAEVLQVTPSWLLEGDNDNRHKKNAALSDIIMRARQDEKFYNAILSIYTLEDAELNTIVKILSGFTK